MSIQNNFIPWSFGATEAMDDAKKGTGSIYKAVVQGTGKFASNGQVATGILQQIAPNSGHVTQGLMGIMKFTAGAAVNSADQELTVTTSGYFKLADDGDYVVGRTLASVSSGSVGYGVFNFVAPALFGDNDIFDFTSTTDLSAAIGLAIDLSTGDVAATTTLASGILVKAVTSGQTGKVKAMGKIPYKAGVANTAGKSLQVTTGGYLLDAGSGDIIGGRATAAVSSGQLGTGIFNFATPHYATTSADGVI